MAIFIGQSVLEPLLFRFSAFTHCIIDDRECLDLPIPACSRGVHLMLSLGFYRVRY